MNQGNQGNQPQQILQQGQHTRSQAQIPTIQLKYVGQFVQALKKEGALAQAATNEADRAKHYAKVESLRQILKKYQTMQQNARQQQQIQMNPQQTPQGSTMNPRLSTSNPGSSQILLRFHRACPRIWQLSVKMLVQPLHRNLERRPVHKALPRRLLFPPKTSRESTRC